MAGISDKSVKTQYATNEYRYNGKELQNQEFADGTGLKEIIADQIEETIERYELNEQIQKLKHEGN
jgi:hypothetical protein